MADKLTFSLVSPERELFHGEVDMVVVPGAGGEFGVLAGHAPLLSIVKPGVLRITDGANVRRIFVNGGFADVTPEGLTVLAEEALDLADAQIDPASLDQDIKDAHEDFSDAASDAARATAQAKIDRAEALKTALAAR
ncbi:MAG: F0F1 ATP synthase subunit epsilon [Caulobacterales bacterium]